MLLVRLALNTPMALFRETVGRLVRGQTGRQFLHRAADWSRSLDVIQLADKLGRVYWCLFVK